MNDYDLRTYRLLKKMKLAQIAKASLIIKDSGIKGLNNKINSRRQWKKNSNVDTRVFENIEFKINSIDIVVDKDIDITKIMNKLEGLNVSYNLFYIMDKPKERGHYYGISELFLYQYFMQRSFVFITKRKKSKLRKEFYYCTPLRNNDSLIENINNLLNSIDTLKVIANYNNKNNITAKAATFFDYDGSNYYSGGAERYLVDLHEVCKNLGHNLDIYQNANFPYMRKFRNINVIGMKAKDMPLNYSLEYITEQAKNYSCMTKYFSKLHIYSAFYECFPYCSSPSIGISHGIAWDNRSCIKTNGIDFWNRNYRMIESAFMCDKMVSVDTNTANWFQTIDFNLGNQKIKVIPNYVDTNEFKPQNDLKKKDKIVITYPRRLYEPRGMYLLLNIVDKLFKEYKNIEIHFVGKGFDEDANKIKEKMKKYPKRLFCYSSIPEKMNEVYKKTDISLIPTIYSEGTSLSCLEAMATGNIVISTRIGGLCDLIIDNYNGYLIEPTEEDLYNKLKYVLDNYDKQEIIKKRARESAETFNKNTWAQKWKNVIKTFNIKSKSQTIPLVEFYVNDIENLRTEIFDKIREELMKNQLIYIRSKKKAEIDNISCGLLQLVPFDEEVVSKAKKIYVDKNIKKKIEREEEIEYI